MRNNKVWVFRLHFSSVIRGLSTNWLKPISLNFKNEKWNRKNYLIFLCLKFYYFLFSPSNEFVSVKMCTAVKTHTRTEQKKTHRFMMWWKYSASHKCAHASAGFTPRNHWTANGNSFSTYARINEISNRFKMCTFFKLLTRKNTMKNVH